MIVGSLIYRAMFESGGGRSSGFGYGNLWLRYSVQERGVLSDQVEWLIATPTMPENQTYRGQEDEWTFIFDSGKEFTFSPDTENLIWIDPVSGPIKISTDLTRELVEQIDKSKADAKGQIFKSGEELLLWLDTKKTENKAEIATPSKPSD